MVVPDLRGYGETEVPKESPAQYQMKARPSIGIITVLGARVLFAFVFLGSIHFWLGLEGNNVFCTVGLRLLACVVPFLPMQGRK